MFSLEMKMVSSLEKCFWDEPLESKQEKTEFIMFRNERLSFQVLYHTEDDRLKKCVICPVKLGGALAPYAKLRLVGNILNMFPAYHPAPDGAYLRTTPGSYPDLLRPMIYPNAVSLPFGQSHALWVDIELPEGFPAGKYDISVTLTPNETDAFSVSGTVQVVDAKLPPQKLIHTEWFYTDCIANHYHTKAFSQRHWELIEQFMLTASRNGINMILTPIITPELDTYVGGERLTTQLVDITLEAPGKYAFGFDKLHRWIDLSLQCGMEYFEIPAFFTQWGAKAAPKIVVRVNGRNKKYFGWHTDSMGEEYLNFLDQFIPAVLEQFKKRNLDHKCYFHISDEPKLSQLEQYARCKKIIDTYLKGYPIIDALTDLDFYSTGVLEKPVPQTRKAQAFVDAKVPNLWVYYAGGGREGTSCRMLSMPAARTRILGVQLYHYNIEGFLHWGYNFYNSRYSYNVLDPFNNPDCGYFTASGDCFLVYPGTDGTAWESLRLNAMREAIDDIRALQLYEEKFGRAATDALINKGLTQPLTFTEYPNDADYLLTLRETIAKAFI